MILRLLNWQGITGIAATAGLAVLLLIQKGEANHWKKQSASFEQLYHQDQAAFATTVADYRAAADQARAADRANATRVAAEQLTINERIEHDFEARLAAARTDARRLRIETDAAADPGADRSAPLPGLPTSPGVPSQATREDRLSRSDALTATEQAIQLDELVKWVRGQAAVQINVAPAKAGASGQECAAPGCSASY